MKAHGKINRYPHFGFKGKIWRANRFSYWMFNGDISEGMSVCHTCDNPLCVNPIHLFLGTHKDNMQDMLSKGRHNYTLSPENIKKAHEANTKLSDDDVRYVRSSELPSKQLAEHFSVHPTLINAIRRGAMRSKVI
jgi:hypothetical protein